MAVGLVIVAHSAQLAAGVAELAGQMTQGAVRIIAAGGTGEGTLGTSTEIILAAIQAADDSSGVLVLLDLGSAILSTEMALEMLDDEQRERVMLSYAPIAEGAVTAALEASLGQTLSQVKAAAEKIATPQQLQQLKPFEQPIQTIPPIASNTTAPSSVQEAQTISLRLTNPLGLHARPASLFVQTAARFQATIRVQSNGKQADATSIIGILSLGARLDETITLSASGQDAEAALTALAELVRANFYEVEEEIQTPPASEEQLPTPPIKQGDHAWHGISTSAGVALGLAFLYMPNRPMLHTVEQRTIPLEQVANEQERLHRALETTIEELQTLAQQLRARVSGNEAAIIEAQEMMLRDPLLRDTARRMIADRQIDAASSLAKVGEEHATTLEKLHDPLLAGRAADIRDATSKAIGHIRGSLTPEQDLSAIDQPVILLARDLTPSDTAKLRPEMILGLCTVLGGPTAHAAILARALGIPAMAGLDELALKTIRTGEDLGLDANLGLLYLNPSPEIRHRLTQHLVVQQAQQMLLKVNASQAQAPLYIGERRIRLLANIGGEAEAEAARQWGAEGIGLLRSEFLFAKATTMPDVEEQRQRYITVFRAFSSSPAVPSSLVTVRTLDAGADKPLPALQGLLGKATEANPALGLRGVRIHLAHPQLLEQQLCALLLAASDTGMDLHIMVPMITTVEEIQTVQTIFQRVYDGLVQRGIKVPTKIPLGIMVEVPAATVMAPELARWADFFSIGSNDLAQYTLACDRTNATVAHLYNPMQPAVLRQIRQVAEAGRFAKKPVAVCGEMAGNPLLAPILVGLGVDELSMTPTAIPKIRETLIKYSAQELSEIAERISRASTVEEVATICNRIV